MHDILPIMWLPNLCLTPTSITTSLSFISALQTLANIPVVSTFSRMFLCFERSLQLNQDFFLHISTTPLIFLSISSGHSLPTFIENI